MTSVLFVSLISSDDRPLYIQSFNEYLDRNKKLGFKSSEISSPDFASKLGTTVPETSHMLSPAEANKILKYNFLSHMALDVFASPISLRSREQQVDQKEVLLLFSLDDVIVYGMETNNGLRILAGTSEEVFSKSQLILLFSQIHKCCLRTICNPFTDVSNAGYYDKMIQTEGFDSRMKTIVSEWEFIFD